MAAIRSRSRWGVVLFSVGLASVTACKGSDSYDPNTPKGRVIHTYLKVKEGDMVALSRSFTGDAFRRYGNPESVSTLWQYLRDFRLSIGDPKWVSRKAPEFRDSRGRRASVQGEYHGFELVISGKAKGDRAARRLMNISVECLALDLERPDPRNLKYSFCQISRMEFSDCGTFSTAETAVRRLPELREVQSHREISLEERPRTGADGGYYPEDRTFEVSAEVVGRSRSASDPVEYYGSVRLDCQYFAQDLCRADCQVVSLDLR